MLAAPLGAAAGATKPRPPLDLGTKVAVVGGAPNHVSASVRLRSTAPSPDAAGFLVESVRVVVE